ncbi:MAG: hypothetical protein ACJ760_11505 [Thermoleophilaceae bacterium]
MTDLITRYEQHFHEAAQRQLRPSRYGLTRRPRRQLAVAGGVALLLVSVPAAADNGWFPFAGRSDPPSTTDVAPAPTLMEMLGVLRRPQTATDRGGDTDYALKMLSGETYDGIQLGYVRRAAVGPADQGVVIIPSLSHRLVPDAIPNPHVICIWRTDYFHGERAGGAPGCFDADDIRRGVALQQLGHRVDMIVPDGVARVAGVSDGGSVDTAVPEDNVASWEGSLPKRVVWYDASGKTLLSVEPGGA